MVYNKKKKCEGMEARICHVARICHARICHITLQIYMDFIFIPGFLMPWGILGHILSLDSQSCFEVIWQDGGSRMSNVFVQCAHAEDALI